MSDQAIVWKFAFGVLVLLLSAVAFVMRKDAEPARETAPLPMVVTPRAAPAPLPAASAPPTVEEPAPADVPDAQETPVRIRIALREPAVIKVHRPPKQSVRHVVHRRPRHVSPYVAGRIHYPFDPRDRWHSHQG
jgi:hypothetical protein